MKKTSIKLNNIEDVKEFNSIVDSCGPEMDLLTGRYIINAKSIMGILSLDLNEVIHMNIHGSDSDCDEVLKAIDKFVVEE